MPDVSELLQKISRKQGLVRNKLLGSPLGKKKVFGIGLNKTGTSTLGACLRTLGFNHLYDVQRLSKFHFDGDHASLFNIVDQYDSFEDWPIPLIYKELNDRYGDDALFILTERITPEAWVNSLSRHAKRINFEGARALRTKIYGYEGPDGHEDEHIAFYNRHNAEVVDYFKERGEQDRLVTLCWEKGDDWDTLCGFLGVKKPWVKFPHVNKGG